MYTPRFNHIDDRALLLEEMQTHSFGILFGPDEEGVPTATHLPLVLHDKGPYGLIAGHFARANKHWQSLAGRETLVIFPGPHGYVSPTLYAEEFAVPTWNYIAIHAYGTLELLEEHDAKEASLEALIALHEPAFAERWNALPAGYKHTMLAGIMAFRIPIARIEGKFKLSQNRSEADRRNVRAAHAAGSPDERQLARWMERLGL